MSEIVIIQPNSENIAAQNGTLLEGALAIVVTNIEEHESALLCLRRLGEAEKAVASLFADPKKKAHEAHKSICTAETRLIEPIQKAKRIVNSKITDYETVERRRAEAERLQLEEAARKAEEDRKLQEAIDAEEAGDGELAEVILSEEIAAPVVQATPAIAKVSGVSSQERWSASVTDLMALIRYVAAHPEWAELLEPNMTRLNGLARSSRSAMNIPGVRAVSESVRAVRSA